MAQTGNHTPGPWRIDPATGRIVADSMSVGRAVVLDVARTFPRRGKQETDANARLIAAAPDLLAEVEALEAWKAEAIEVLRLLSCFDLNHATEHDDMIFENCVNAARGLVEKAALR